MDFQTKTVQLLSGSPALKQILVILVLAYSGCLWLWLCHQLFGSKCACEKASQHAGL